MNINLLAPINQLGYGIAGLNVAKCLDEHADVSLFPMGPIEVTNQEDAEYIRKCLHKSQMLDFDAPCIKIWHQHDMAQFAGRGLRIGFPFFELDVFNDVEKHHLNNVDGLFVTCDWAKEVCVNNLNIPQQNIEVVPLGVDTNIFRPSHNVNAGKTIFYNCGKWEIRKGHDILVDIFCKAFNEEDNVELWMMCSNPFLQPNEQKEWENLYINSKLGSKIKILPRAKTQAEVYNIMSEIDCGVFPSRAEGWNLELLELMSCGKNVIATNYSAHTAFCNKDNCKLVDIKSTESAYDGKWFFGSGSWAKIEETQVDEFVDIMRSIHNDKQNGNLPINQTGIKTSEEFTWSNSARKIIQYVQLF
tara:strand:+ start:7093 stop:8169 length:1077 start_codon:yes stop_codon:yes gene_type:complete